MVPEYICMYGSGIYMYVWFQNVNICMVPECIYMYICMVPECICMYIYVWFLNVYVCIYMYGS